MSFDFLFDPQMWVALFTLATLEIVLGVDNLVFISIAVSRLPEAQRLAARRIGLGLACGTRILLLLSLAWLAGMDDTRLVLFHLFGEKISLRDIVLIGGGLFLIVKALIEIREELRGAHETHATAGKVAVASFAVVITQIAIIDIVFSLDSVITAVGMVRSIPVMITAIVLAVAVMLFAANPVGNFIDNHPTVKMLALAFLVLIGVALVADGFELHVPRAYLYFAMGFSAVVESLNLYARRRTG